ncbi:MAG: ABC transporter ATP-binding protein [Candidatus Omnitrophica bacterium]|nr:ABC transporter ATP-binding protein [Candidatus Omnitrophota bacterium]
MSCYELEGVRQKFNEFTLKIEKCCFIKGKIYSLVGPNGCGKSTFLNILSFLDKPLEGKISFKGKTVDNSNPREVVSLRRQIGYFLQNTYLFNMSVYDNVAYGLKLRKIPESEIRRRAGSMLATLSLSHISDKHVRRLSGGEAQKVALARTLVLDTDVLLLDEPTSNVDKNSTRVIEEVVLALNKERQTTVFVATHSFDQAYRLSHNVVSMINGGIKEISCENVFSGVLVKEENDLYALKLTDTVVLKLVYCENKLVTVVVDPKDIVLSLEQFDSSACNSFSGKINKIEEVNGFLRVFVDVGVIFCAVVTQASFHRLQLNIGRKIWVTFKVASVKVL